MGAPPWQGSIASGRRSLAHAGCDERDRAVKITVLTPRQNLQGLRSHHRTGQDARRTGEADWVHDVCPPWPADRG